MSGSLKTCTISIINQSRIQGSHWISSLRNKINYRDRMDHLGVTLLSLNELCPAELQELATRPWVKDTLEVRQAFVPCRQGRAQRLFVAGLSPIHGPAEWLH